MSNWFWKNLNYLFGLGAIGTLFVLIFFAAQIEIKDLDLWLHIGTGRYIVENQSIPKVDVLSCAMADKPWINHEWFFQVIVYFLFEHFGADGLIQLQASVVILTFVLLLFLGYQREKQTGRVFVLLLVFLIYQARFTLRPDIFSLLFFTLYIYFLTFLLKRGWMLIFVFLIQVLWTNMHGFFILGPLIVGINLCAEYFKRRQGWPERLAANQVSSLEYKHLKWSLGGALLACFINPYTIQGALYPAGVLFSLSGESKIFFQYIAELKRPLVLGNLLDASHYPVYKLLIIISLFSFLNNCRKINIGLLLFWFIFLGISLIAIRNLVFFALAAYFVFIFNAQNISLKKFYSLGLKKDRVVYILSLGLNIILILWMVNYLEQISSRGYFDFDRLERKSEYGGISLRNFPTKAVDFLTKNKVKGNFLNDFNSGAYLVGRCSPSIKVFIDGRTEVYGPQFFEYYRKIWQGGKNLLKEAIDRYQLTGAFLHALHNPLPSQPLRNFYENKEWVLVYFDYDAVIFLKDIALNREVINRHRIDLSQMEPRRVNLLELGVKNVTPYQQVNRAYVLFNLGLYDQAKIEIEEALRVIPDYTEAYKLLGRILFQRREYPLAFENLRKAKILNPADMETHYFLAQVFYELNAFEQSEKECQRILSENPQNAKALFLLSLIYAKKGKDSESSDAFDKAISLDSSMVEEERLKMTSEGNFKDE